MGKNNKFGGRKNNRGFNSRASARQVMHKAVCSACGKDCEVPFKPTGDKPVFCNECFRSKRGDESRRFSQKDSSRFNAGDKKMYEAVCDECGKKCEVPFRPTSDKPIYCKQCFDRRDKDKSSGQASRQFEIIIAKLDEILKAITSAIPVEKDKKEKTIKKVKTPKPGKANKGKPKKAASPKKPKAKKKK